MFPTSLGLMLSMLLASPADDTITTAEIFAAEDRAVEIILSMQEQLSDSEEEAREWPYEGVYRERGQIPIGYRIGGTAIASRALLEARNWEKNPDRQQAVKRATSFILDHLADEKMSAGFSGGYDVRGWGHTYALDFLLRLSELERVAKADSERVKSAIGSLVSTLESTEIADTGGWNYSRRRRGGSSPASPFMTAPTIQALLNAKAAGIEVDDKVLERAIASLEKARLETGAFQYSTRPDNQTGEGFEAVPGAIARMAACETTLLLCGRGSAERVEGAIEAFFEHWQWLEKRRRQTGTHIPPYFIAPYYFYFGHYYVAQAIEVLPEEKQEGYRQRLIKTLWTVREKSGGFNDRVFERSENYGTAMVLLSLRQPHFKLPARLPDRSRKPVPF